MIYIKIKIKFFLGSHFTKNIATIQKPPQHYTIDDWNLNNVQKKCISENQQQLANRIIQ